LTDKKEEESSKEENVATLDKHTIYGGVIVVLVALLTISVLTNGFGGCSHISGEECPDCPICDNGECEVCPEIDEYAGVPTISVTTGDLPAHGQDSAVATLIEVSDYQCPYCARFHLNTMVPLKESHVATGELKMYFRDFPLSFHAHALDAAVAARCANKQGKFWEYNNILFENQDAWGAAADVRETFSGYAGDLAMNVADFQSCYDAREHEASVNADMTSAATAGVQGTPGSFLVIPKDSVDAATFKAAVSAIQAQYGSGVKLYHDDENVIVFVGGAYPYEVFTALLDTIE